MRNTLLIASLFVLLVVSNAETFQKAKMRGMGKHMTTNEIFSTMKESQFGRNLLNLLSLKFQTSSEQNRLQGLLDVLQQLENELGSQQTTEDQQFTDGSNHWNGVIDEQTGVIADAVSLIADYSNQLSESRDHLSGLNTARNLLIQERNNINDFLSQLGAAREAERAAFQERQRNTEVLAQGVARTLALFSDLVGNSELDSSAVQQVSDLLRTVEASLAASSANDQAAEAQAEASYQSFVQNREARLEDIRVSVAGLDAEIAATEARIAELESNIAAQEARRDNAVDVRQQATDALAALTQRYLANQAVRSEQVRLLNVVRSVLSSNADDVQAVLANAL